MYDYLTEDAIDQFIGRALTEDIGEGDHSTLGAVPEETQNKAQLIIKDKGVVAGVSLALRIFRLVDAHLKINVLITDGTEVKYGDIVLTVEGKARSILQAERLVLNCMQRMSGIATYTKYMTSLIAGTNTQLLDTRKTTPNFRIPEKWAVKIGGGVNHRFGLFDAIMLKDNHIDYSGGITKALENTFKYLESIGKQLDIIVETRNLEEVKEVVQCGGVKRILLDNMSLETLRQAVAIIGDSCDTEASGGITETTIGEIAKTGVDYISVGALTHSCKSLDMSLKAF